MAMEDYKKALKLGNRSYHASMSEGQYPYLPSLLEMLPQGATLKEINLGLVQIPMELIAGTYTAGRQNAFAPNFMPLLDIDTEFAIKWGNLSTAHVEEGIRDPIIAYEYMNHFYVKEGNKRVSVLQYYGAVSVPGEVIRILPEKNGDKDHQIYYEFVDFYKYSQINYLLFTKEGSYAELTELLDMAPDHEWTDEEKEFFYSFYYRFKSVYEAKGGNKNEGTVGDALLIYVRMMGYDEVKSKVAAEIKEDLGKIWSEFGLKQDKVELVMEPEQQTAPHALINNINKMLPLSGNKKLKVAFIHDKTGETSSWTYAHELGRMYVEEVFGDKVETKAYMNALTSPQETIEQAIDEGHTIIFTTTPQLNAASLRAAVDHPDVRILNCSLNISHSYIKTYYARLYEAKVLTGIIAGALADNNKIGYIADYPIAGMAANINAFAIGAQMANPRAKIYLKWSSEKDSHPLEELLAEGVRVCSGQDMITPNENRRIFGVCTIDGDDINNVATSVTDWGKLYEQILNVALAGSAVKEGKSPKSFNYWWGMDAGVVDVIWSTHLQSGTQKLIELVRNNIAERKFKPFDGELIAQEGEIIQRDGAMTPEHIVSMDWLADNIIGDIPKLDELKQEARAVAILQSIDKTVKD